MNKEISLKNDVIALFFFCIITVIVIFVARYISKILGLSKMVRNIYTMVGLLFLILLIVFMIYVLKINKTNLVKRNIILTIILVSIFAVLSFTSMYVINKIVVQKYSKVTNKILEYCDEYQCDRYATLKEEKYLDFKISNDYTDYNNNKKTYEIHNYCTTDEIKKIKVVIYSDNDSYSEDLIIRLISDYFSKYDINISKEKITQAFEERLDGNKIKDDNISYMVLEIYKTKGKNKTLEGLKTIIDVSLDK